MQFVVFGLGFLGGFLALGALVSFGAEDKVLESVTAISVATFLLTMTTVLLRHASQWRIAQKKAAFDFIQQIQSDIEFSNASKTFDTLAKDKRIIEVSPFGKDTAKRCATLCGQVDHYLNWIEMAAVGVESQIFDKKLFREWMAPWVKRDLEAAADYIAKVREESPETFCAIANLRSRRWWGEVNASPRYNFTIEPKTDKTGEEAAA